MEQHKKNIEAAIAAFSALSDDEVAEVVDCKKKVWHDPKAVYEDRPDPEQAPKLRNDFCYHLQAALAVLDSHQQ